MTRLPVCGLRKDTSFEPSFLGFVAAVQRLREVINTTIARAQSQGCAHSGCADGQHSPACPLGVIAALQIGDK